MSARGQKLVDAAFTRGLSPGEQARLQEELQASNDLQERYRRLQLAERVATLGPDKALDEPSEFEIDRMAQRLGLLDTPAPARRFIPVWAWSLPLVVSAAAAAMFVLAPAPQTSAEDPGALIARGQADGPTFSVYVADSAGGFALQSDVIKVSPQKALMLRGSGAVSTDVWQAVWIDDSGTAARVALPAPDSSGALAKAVLVPKGARRLILLVGSQAAVDAFDLSSKAESDPPLKGKRIYDVEGADR